MAVCRVDVWVWSLDGLSSEALRARAALLGPEERERAARFVRTIDRERFIAAHARMRQILGSYLDAAPEALMFEAGRAGKPFLACAGAPKFSLSHTAGVGALGVTHDLDIGVDVEMVRPIKEGVAQAYFAPDENAAISALDPEASLIAFYRCWTRKEAFVKALGEGLSVPLDSFSVSVSETATLLRNESGMGAPASGWALRNLPVALPVVGAVAAQCGDLALTLRT